MDVAVWTGRHATALRKAFRAVFPELSDERLADRFQVSPRTLYDWQRRPDAVLRPGTQALLKETLAGAGEAVRGKFRDLMGGGSASTSSHHIQSPTLTATVAPNRDDLAAMRSFRAADLQVGGGHLYSNVVQYLNGKVGPRLFSFGDGSTTAAVLAAGSGLTEMAGWMAHDAGRDQVANQHFLRSLDLATAAGDTQLQAHILGSLSHLAEHKGSPDDAIRYSRRGLDALQATPNPALEARLYTFEARASAALGDSAACGKYLFRAEKSLERLPDVEPSPWVGPFDEGSLASEAVRSLRQLSQLDPARQHAERIIELRRGRARSHAFGLLGLAQIIALQPQPDLEHACAVAGQALDATQSLSSYLVIDQLRTLERLVQPYEPNEFVKDFRERLRVHLEEHIGFYEWMTGSTNASSPEPS